MYTLRDKTKIVELEGHQISDSTLENIKKEYDVNDQEVEEHIQSIADRAVAEFLERFAD
jgi:hypothetical protein